MTREPRTSYLLDRKKRLPGRRKAVTIIAGFRCVDGVVICADTQETLGTAKRNVPKLRFEPSRGEVEENFSNLAVAFCGAGDGPFIDKLAQEAWTVAKDQPDFTGACEAIEHSIKSVYAEFGRIYQPGYCPDVKLIYGVKMDGQSKLFSADGPIVNERSEYDTGGKGHYMADFLAGKMFDDSLTVNQCAILAAYVLFQAKEHVEECGGDSLVTILRNNGASGMVNWHRIIGITEMIQAADDTAGEIMMQLADVGGDDAKAIEQIEFHLSLMFQLRDNYKKRVKLQEAPEYHDSIDFLGLPLAPKKKEVKGGA